MTSGFDRERSRRLQRILELLLNAGADVNVKDARAATRAFTCTAERRSPAGRRVTRFSDATYWRVVRALTSAR